MTYGAGPGSENIGGRSTKILELYSNKELEKYFIDKKDPVNDKLSEEENILLKILEEKF